MFFKLPNLHMMMMMMKMMMNEKKSPSLPRNLAIGTSSELLILFSAKVILLYLLYSTAQRSGLLYLIKKNCLLIFFKNYNLDDLGISLPVFPPRTNLKLHIFLQLPRSLKGYNKPWFIKGVWSWFDSKRFKKLWAWIFIKTSSTFQYVSEGVLFWRLFEGHIGGSCI